MPTGWRIVKTSRTDNAFDGEGARLYGGRWNRPGTAMVYTSAARSLAALEMLAHLGDSGVLGSYSVIPAHFDEEQIETLTHGDLPKNWREAPAPAAVQLIGNRWAEQARSLVLEVPSVIVPEESNFLINPAHPDFKTLRIGKPVPFRFDKRLR